jgi:hypothetical protein
MPVLVAHKAEGCQARNSRRALRKHGASHASEAWLSDPDDRAARHRLRRRPVRSSASMARPSDRLSRADGAGGGTRTLTGLPPTDFRTSYGFRRRPKAFVVWTIPSPWRPQKRSAVGAARLVSTPSPIGLPDRGLARDRHLTGFPDFEQFYVPGFPARTQVV